VTSRSLWTGPSSARGLAPKPQETPPGANGAART
jgi:hypothetical protein